MLGGVDHQANLKKDIKKKDDLYDEEGDDII